jgi:hypothetical protein
MRVVFAPVMFAVACLFATSRIIAAESDPGAVGAWWRQLPNAAGPPVLQVFELRSDGVFVTYGPEYLQDRGRYSLAPGIIHVESALNPKIAGDMGYQLQQPDHLTLMLGPPLNQVQEWRRVAWPPYFDDARVGGRSAPKNVDTLIKRVVFNARDIWRPDAAPQRLVFEVMKNHDMRATVDLCSPSDGACQRLQITRFDFKVVPYQTPPGARGGFPAAFLDLAEAVEIAQGLGFDGELKKASIGLGSPNWGLVFTGSSNGQAGIVVDGVTGEPVVNDMNAVMADYNRQWDEAIEGLRRVFAQKDPSAQGQGCFWDDYDWISETHHTGWGGVVMDEGTWLASCVRPR